MAPGHRSKRGVRYRYYVSVQDREKLKLKPSHVPAGDLEGLILAQLHDHLGTEPDSSIVRDHVEKVVVDKDRILVTLRSHEGSKRVEIPSTWVRRGNQRPMLGDQGQRDPALVKLLVGANQAKIDLKKAATVAAAAQAMGLPEQLPRERVVIAALEACPCCGSDWTCNGFALVTWPRQKSRLPVTSGTPSHWLPILRPTQILLWPHPRESRDDQAAAG